MANVILRRTAEPRLKGIHDKGKDKAKAKAKAKATATAHRMRRIERMEGELHVKSDPACQD